MPTDTTTTVRRRSPLWGTLLIALALIGFALLYASRPQSKPLETREKTWTVATHSVRLVEARPLLRLYGRVETPVSTRLTAGVAADVLEVDVLEGQQVSRDQLLLSLDPRDYQALLRQREAEVQDIQAQIAREQEKHRYDLSTLTDQEALLDLQRRSVKRALDLAERKVGSESGVDEARKEERRQSLAMAQRRFALSEHQARLKQLEAQADRARAQLDQARLQLDRTIVRAPFDGRIAERLVAPGQRVRDGELLLRLYDTTALEVRAQIPTSLVDTITGAVAAGEHLSAELAGHGPKTPLVLHRLAAEISRGSGGLDALFRFSEQDSWLPVGRTVELSLALPLEAGVAALPLEALYGRDRIYRVRDERMRALKVERLGRSQSANGERLALVRHPDLQDGDEIVITQLPNAGDGLRIQRAENLTMPSAP